LIYNPYEGSITSGSITFWVPAGSTVSMQAYQGQDSAGYPTFFSWYYDSDTGSTITNPSYSFNPSSPDTIDVAYLYSGYVVIYDNTYVSGTTLQTTSSYEPANMYYYWTPPSSIAAYGQNLAYQKGPSSIWVYPDQTNTATDLYTEPAAWSGLSLSVSAVGGVNTATTSGYLIDPATGGGIGSQTINLQYSELFLDGTGNNGPSTSATTGSNGYFYNQQGLPANLQQVTVYISWSNPPSYYCNPGTATLTVTGDWP